jgi:hypothetical protein
MRPPRVAVGIRDLSGRDETGQAAVVTLSLDRHDPDHTNAVILDHRDIDLCGVDLPPRVYHAAKGLSPHAAQALVDHVAAAAARAAGDEIDELLTDMRSAGHTIDAVSVAVDESGPDIVNTPLADLLDSHTRIHAAENALYREALASAAADRGAAVFRYPSRSLAEAARTALRLSPDQIARRLDIWGRLVGRPWRRHHKDAALAAWLALAAGGARPRQQGDDRQVDPPAGAASDSGNRGR